jgi:2-desacetyl-2-hydroxyethyl bacteriochlorophyllide A dehydrogenase
MRAVVYRGPGAVEVCEDLPEPAIGEPRDAVVRVTRSAICGSDLHPYRGHIPGFAPGTVLGHEFVGVVVEAGPEVPFPPGTRVVASDVVACGRCRSCAKGWHYHCPEATLFGYSTVVGRSVAGGQSEYVRVPFADTVLSPCPDDTSDEHMLFVGDLLSTAYAAARAAVSPGAVVGVVGGGALGLLSALCAGVFGAAEVAVADRDPTRRAMAEALGFAAVDPADLPRLLESRGDGAVIEAVGTDAALRCAIASAGRRGGVVAVGAHSSTAMPLDTQRAFTRELTLRFIVGDPIRDHDEVVALLRAGRIDPTVVVSDRLPLRDAVEGYRRFDRRAALKVLLLP